MIHAPQILRHNHICAVHICIDTLDYIGCGRDSGIPINLYLPPLRGGGHTQYIDMSSWKEDIMTLRTQFLEHQNICSKLLQVGGLH